jgi:uncharacterized protein (DUF1330 family)
MPAYVIADVRVTDPGVYGAYAARTPEVLRKYGARFVVRGGTAETLEGDWSPQRLVVLEFPSAEAARAWYDSPEYAELRELRRGAATGSLVLVEGTGGT